MAKISLRVYNREIEALIDRGQTEEAIAHCKFILKTYPKHLESYRLLGKAFLESQRYSEAADILQRILSVQPDDFVSQIGMSIIREDEGNLDAAIYHMERAFEIQSSNAAIQDELRRLYGRRDGIEPPKLRLTRGALVRMYARGDLYRQAIAESRAALKEDPQRFDLEIVLARMYFQTGQKAEAAEISSRLVTKLPYCFEANRILAEVLPETSRAEDARLVQQKLIALDPYLGYAEAVPGAQQSPDNAVALDRLEWSPSLESDQQPAWARSLGINLEKTPTEEVPQWMTTIETGHSSNQEQVEEPPSRPFSEEPALFENNLEPSGASLVTAREEPPAANIPDWMQTAGWQVSNNPAAEEAASFETASDLDAAAPAELPSWLKEMAPSQASNDESPSDLGWMESDVSQINAQTLLPGQASALQFPPVDETAEALPAATEDLPDWLKAPVIPADDNMFAAQNDEPLPDWLMPATDMQSETSSEAQEALAMGWLTSRSNTPATPDQWTPDAIEDSEPPQEQEIQSAAAVGGISLTKASPAVSPTPPELTPAAGEQPDLDNFDQAMAWLESLAAKQGADEETLLTRPDDRTEAPPEWVSQAAQAAEVPPADLAPAEGIADQEFIPPAINLSKTNAAPSVLEPLAETAAPLPELELDAPAALPEAEITSDRMTENLSGSLETETQFTLPDEAVLPASEIAEIDAATLILPVAAVTEEPLPAEPEPNAPTAAIPKATPMAEMDIDSAFAWLESLAAKQGAEADTLLVSPENRSETPPDWVQQQSAEEVPTPEEPTLAAVPEWARETTETPFLADESQPAAAADLPDWLRETDSTASISTIPIAAVNSDLPEESALESEPVAADLPTADAEPAGSTWIQEFEAEQNAAPEPPQAAAEIPNPPEPQRKPGFGYTRPLPSWLVGETPPTAAAPAESLTSPEPALPDWLKTDEATQMPPEAAGAAEEQTDANSPALPDWLSNLDAEPEEDLIPSTPVLAASAASRLPEVEISSDPGEMIGQAQAALAKGQIDLSLTIYARLILVHQHLEETIHDLRDALYRYPVDSAIWQTLGDAYFQNNRIQDALDAYTKAEDFLK